jgi:hypothetical protein
VITVVAVAGSVLKTSLFRQRTRASIEQVLENSPQTIRPAPIRYSTNRG